MADRPLNWNCAPASVTFKKIALEIANQARRYEEHWFPEECSKRSAVDQRILSTSIIQLASDVAAAAVVGPGDWLVLERTTLTQNLRHVLEILSAPELGFIRVRASGTVADSAQGSIAIRAGDRLLGWIHDKGITGDDISQANLPLETPMLAGKKWAEKVLSADDDPRRSVRLNLAFCLSDQYESFVEEMSRTILVETETRVTRDSTDTTTRALRLILGNLLRAHQVDRKRYVSLALGRNRYPRGAFNPTDVGSRGVRRVIEYLSSTKPALIHVRKGGYFTDPSGNRTHGFNTRIRATADLIALIERALTKGETSSCPSGNSSEADPYSFSAGRHFRVYDLPIIRLKDANKNLIEGWEETPDTENMRRRLERYNRFLKLHWIDLLLPSDEFAEAVTGNYEGVEDRDEFGESDDPDTRRVDLFFGRSLYRVFNNSSFEEGGRFYGGWWQNIPGRYRKFVTINWTPTVELDYSNMQPRMLYAMEGERLEGDAYAIKGIDPQYRNLIKRTLFKLINARGRMKAPLKSERPPGWEWRDLLEALRQKHAPIAKYFNSGIGIELQRSDADIAEEVMQKFMHRNVLVLPVHDSFLAYVGQERALNEAMITAFRERFGQDIEIDADEKFVETVLGRDAMEDDHAGVYSLADAFDDYVDRPEFAGYRKRRRDFLSYQSEGWRWQFYSH